LKPAVHFTHNDLDAIGCMLHLHAATINTTKITFCTNYRDLDEKASRVIEYCTNNPIEILVISDISFASHKELLLSLQDLQKYCKVLFIDHHEYPSDFFDDITMTYRHDISKSATSIMRDFFSTTNEQLNALSELIEIFDIWIDTNTQFPLAVALNEYFQQSLRTKDILSIYESIIRNNYKLPSDFVNWYKQYKLDYTSFIDTLKRKNLLMSDGFFTVVFTDEYFNEILLEEFRNGTSFALIANSYGIVRYRFNTAKLNRESKEAIKLKLIGTLDIGHLNAFSDKIQNSNFNKIMDKVQEVHHLLEAYKN